MASGKSTVDAAAAATAAHHRGAHPDHRVLLDPARIPTLRRAVEGMSRPLEPRGCPHGFAVATDTRGRASVLDGSTR